MAKTYMSHTKYIIHQRFKVKGVVEKHDIIGAIFGQSEGLTGEDLSLKELQSTGKIGRIELIVESKNGASEGTIEIPSSADMVETAILAATVEAVDKVGPCDATFVTEKIEDTRSIKRKVIVLRAKALLSQLIKDEIPDSQEITKAVEEEVRAAEVISYGKDKLPAGPNIRDADDLILVEGRADVINLLKYNIRNVAAFGGSNITPTVVELCNKKTCTVFIDGDRGGELNLKKLMQMATVDFVAKAPSGTEVEELTKKEILLCLKKRIPITQTKLDDKLEQNVVSDLNVPSLNDVYKKDRMDPKKTEGVLWVDKKPEYSNNTTRSSIRTPTPRNVRPSMPVSGSRDSRPPRPAPRPIAKKSNFDGVDGVADLEKIKGKLKANLYSSGKLIESIQVKDVIKAIKDNKDITLLVYDGIVTKRLAELAKAKGIKDLVCLKVGKMSKIKGINITTLE